MADVWSWVCKVWRHQAIVAAPVVLKFVFVIWIFQEALVQYTWLIALDKVSKAMWSYRKCIQQLRPGPLAASHKADGWWSLRSLGKYLCQREWGQSLVEFAVILPLLLLVVLGTVDLGMGFKTYIGLTNAAREGVRWISIHPGDKVGTHNRIAAEALRVGLQDAAFMDGGYSVSFSPDKASYQSGDKVTITIDYDYELLFGAVTGLPTIQFTASSTMVVLYDN